jgi:Ran GTPase-activating protein (RanGAP) involved in mRNA processing and transport
MSMFDGKTDLDMSNKGLDAGDAFMIAAALQENPTVDSIIIGSKDQPATIPLKQLRENSIEALDFQGKQLLALGGIVLASALRENASVTVLNVSKNALREVGVKTISEMLKANKTLTEVDLSENQIGGYEEYDEDVQWVFKATPEGPAALADALKANTNLQRLNVSSNDLGPEGGKAIAASIAKNSTITSVSPLFSLFFLLFHCSNYSYSYLSFPLCSSMLIQTPWALLLLRPSEACFP